MIPITLADWTLSLIEGLLDRGIFESETFAFKKELPHRYPKMTGSCARLSSTRYLPQAGEVRRNHL
jgi:hypothetical protein